MAIKALDMLGHFENIVEQIAAVLLKTVLLLLLLWLSKMFFFGNLKKWAVCMCVCVCARIWGGGAVVILLAFEKVAKSSQACQHNNPWTPVRFLTNILFLLTFNSLLFLTYFFLYSSLPSIVSNQGSAHLWMTGREWVSIHSGFLTSLVLACCLCSQSSVSSIIQLFISTLYSVLLLFSSDP